MKIQKLFILVYAAFLIELAAPYACFCDETSDTDLEFDDGTVRLVVRPDNLTDEDGE